MKLETEITIHNEKWWTVYDDRGFIIIRTTNKELAIGAYKNGRV